MQYSSCILNFYLLPVGEFLEFSWARGDKTWDDSQSHHSSGANVKPKTAVADSYEHISIVVFKHLPQRFWRV
jgi:hypothetical protein